MSTSSAIAISSLPQAPAAGQAGKSKGQASDPLGQLFASLVPAGTSGAAPQDGASTLSPAGGEGNAAPGQPAQQIPQVGGAKQDKGTGNLITQARTILKDLAAALDAIAKAKKGGQKIDPSLIGNAVAAVDAAKHFFAVHPLASLAGANSGKSAALGLQIAAIANVRSAPGAGGASSSLEVLPAGGTASDAAASGAAPSEATPPGGQAARLLSRLDTLANQLSTDAPDLAAKLKDLQNQLRPAIEALTQTSPAPSAKSNTLQRGPGNTSVPDPGAADIAAGAAPKRPEATRPGQDAKATGPSPANASHRAPSTGSPAKNAPATDARPGDAAKPVQAPVANTGAATPGNQAQSTGSPPAVEQASSGGSANTRIDLAAPKKSAVADGTTANASKADQQLKADSKFKSDSPSKADPGPGPIPPTDPASSNTVADKTVGSSAAQLTSAPITPSASAPSGASAPSQPATAYQNSQSPVEVPQLAFEVARHVQAGQNHFQIRLDPAHLGHIEIALHVDGSGTVHARLTADHPDTLSLLQHDARGLERALVNAGADAGKANLEFSLRQNPFGQQAGQQGHPQGQPNTPAELLGDAGSGNGAGGPSADVSPAAIATYSGIARQGGLDIRV